MVMLRTSLLLTLPSSCAALLAGRSLPSQLTPRATRRLNAHAVTREPPLGAVHAQTLAWIQNYVIGLNLCPFAKNALLSGGLMVEVFSGTDADDLREEIVEKAAMLSEDKAGGTVIHLLPPFATTFLFAFSQCSGGLALCASHD